MRINNKLNVLIGLVALLTMGTARAEDIELDTITVKGQTLEATTSAFTQTTIDNDQLRGQSLDQPLRIIEQIPGMDLGAYRQGGIADVFTIRGFGNAGHGGDAAIYIDGIPLNERESHSDGYADTNVLIPAEIERLTVYKGPVSPVYGNFARGGALAFFTRKGGDYQEFDLSAGQWNTFDAQAALGGEFGPVTTNLALQGFHTDGWRDNNRYLKTNAAGRVATELGPDTRIALSGRAHGGEWDAPGYLPESQYRDDERRAEQAINAENDGGNKRFFTQRLDLYQDLGEAMRLLAFAYATQQDFTRFAKFGFDPGGQTERFYDRDVFGGGVSLNASQTLAETDIDWVLGLEHYYENTQWRRWDTADRVRQQQTQERDFLIQTTSAFTQVDLAVHPLLMPTLGLRLDRFGGEFDNHDPGRSAVSRDMQEFTRWSPKFGLRSQLAEAWQLRFSAANGYALPQGEAKYDPTLNVDAIKFWQYELGLNATPARWLYLDVAAFILDSSDEILEQPLGSGEFRNVGKTRRQGIEADIRLYPTLFTELKAALSYLDSEIREHPDPTIEGREVVGVPNTQTTLVARYAPPTGWGARTQWRYLGAYPLTDDNRVEYPGHHVIDAGIFYSAQLANGRSFRWYLDINNLTDRNYAEAVFYGFGTRNFAPAPPINVMSGIQFAF